MKKSILILAVIMLLSLSACSGGGTKNTVKQDSSIPVAAPTETLKTAPTLTLIGHASFKIKTSEGKVIYVDPYYQPGDYSEGADLILVSHDHSDHNVVSLCKKNEGCAVLTHNENINKDKSFNIYKTDWVVVEPVAAYNKNHPEGTGSGFVITFDGVTIYIAGDTSKIPEMADLKTRNIDYAFFPIDGKYNMGPAEAMECAAMVGAKHNTPIHFFSANPDDFKPENLLKMAYGDTIELVHS